ncbi:efflux transporter outer membrane subunit [Parvularcula dongshanensis]|uniref:NodT family efflux transporter outer membrane factor (OMF) lipoprotein n=1 Tax=Parvularcula dongshanensis TaxID=1173995 RepID=A0A840I4G6_9PROT|nr:TolC family protein [Parvularcula dongshanensis]MBB4659225.1 NodT family efflux transporter outer membrane factor (OMF) lipoprotein [Parvularcula dongshanensis]
MGSRPKRCRTSLLRVASVLALAACASVGPEDALAPVAVPGDWAAVSADLAPSGSEMVTGDWLAELSDPQVENLVAEAVTYNNDLAASGARVRAVLAQARIARAGLLPSVSAGLTGSSTRTPGGAFTTTGPNGEVITGSAEPSSSDGYTVGFNASWEADIWGRILDGTRAAYLDAEAQRLDYAAAALSVAGGTVQSFYTLTEARLQTELAERDVETGEANLRIIERRYDRGISSSLDVRLARASLAQSQAQLLARRQSELESARRLEVLLGRYPSANLEVAKELPTLPALAAEDGAVIGIGSPIALLSRRPDVLSAEAQLSAAGLRVSEARKALLPSLRISGSADNRFDTFSNITFDPDDVIAQLVGSLVQPLFQGGRLRAAVQAQRAAMEAAVYAYASTVLTAYREVEDAIAAEVLLAAQQDARRLAFEEAAAAESLTERQYLSGTTDIFNLISAQQRRITSESQYIASTRARLTNRVGLYLALGAPFEIPTFTRPDVGERFTPPTRDPALDGSRTVRRAV